MIPLTLRSWWYGPVPQDESSQSGPAVRFFSWAVMRRLVLAAGMCVMSLVVLFMVGQLFSGGDPYALPAALAEQYGAGSAPVDVKPVPHASDGVGPVADAATPSPSPAPANFQSVDWKRFAYVQYATNLPYLCNSLMLFARVAELGCNADRLLMHNNEWSLDGDSQESRLLREMLKYGVTLQPVEIQRRNWLDPTWAESYTKLLAVNQTQYDRVLSLDSDSIVLQCMDELFLLPSAPFAMPRSYWVWPSHPELSDQLLLAEPNAKEMDRILRAVASADEHTFDMDIMNNLYLPHAMVLPHREYDLITGEFRTENGAKQHTDFLGNDYETWDPHAIVKKAKFLHFSDWPIPKPWLPITQSALNERGPKCVSDNDCADRDLWFTFYGDFKRRRMDVCGFGDWGGQIKPATLI